MPNVMPWRLKDLAQHKGPEDFKKRVNEYVKTALPGFKPLGSDVLVATYVQAEKTAGGIIRVDRVTHEDMWQGRAGLILAMGPTAFKYAVGGYAWEGTKAEVGDWVVFRFADSWDLHMEGVGCRIVDASSIRAIVDDPETVYAESVKRAAA